MIICPECGRKFENSSQFNPHWGHSHEGPTPDDVDTTRSDEIRQKMSDNSARYWDGVSGEDHPAGGITFEQSEEAKQAMAEAKFGDKNPAKRPEVRRKLRENHPDFTGKNHPRWKDEDYERPYDPDFRANKEIVRRRDNYRCQFCGLSQASHQMINGRRLDVHHVNGDSQNSSLGNLLTMCRICHRRFEHR